MTGTTWNCCHLGVSSVYTCYHTLVYSVTCLAVPATCTFGWMIRVFYCSTAVTGGGYGNLNKNLTWCPLSLQIIFCLQSARVLLSSCMGCMLWFHHFLFSSVHSCWGWFVQIRSFQTSTTQRDIDQAAKYIGAGAATVGVAGSGTAIVAQEKRFC